MNVILYNISDPPNKVNKKLGTGKTIEGVVFKENDYLNILTPTIVLNLSDEISDYSHYNYVYIKRFARYYYITNMTAKGGLVEISCKSDPLKSFSKDILKSSQYVVRSQTSQNKYIPDTLLPFTSRHKYYSVEFGDPVTDIHCQCVIMETIGKGGTPV
jgi:hypothetical protein